MDKTEQFDKTVTDFLICDTTHPNWIIGQGQKLDLRKPQSRKDLAKLARMASPFKLKNPPKKEDKPSEPTKAADGKTSNGKK